jgi:hypothetical protein
MKSGERFVEGEGNQRGSRWVREKKAAAFNSETGNATRWSVWGRKGGRIYERRRQRWTRGLDCNGTDEIVVDSRVERTGNGKQRWREWSVVDDW